MGNPGFAPRVGIGFGGRFGADCYGDVTMDGCAVDVSEGNVSHLLMRLAGCGENSCAELRSSKACGANFSLRRASARQTHLCCVSLLPFVL